MQPNALTSSPGGKPSGICALQRKISAAAGLFLFGAMLSVQSQDSTAWIGDAGDFLENSNWDNRAPGLGTLQEGFFYINNGGIASLSATRQISGGGLADFNNSSGTLHILSGGHLESIRGEGEFGAFGTVYIGGYGAGTLSIAPGAGMTNVDLSLAEGAGSTGIVTIQGGTLTNSNSFTIGSAGSGTLTMSGSAVANNQNVTLGHHAGSSGAATISSGALTASQTLTVAAAGSGTLTASHLSTLSSGTAILGGAAGASGQVTLDASTWNNVTDLIVGSSGTGAIQIQNGSTLTVGGNATLSANAGSGGSVAVNEGSWSVGQFLTIGQGAAGSVTVGASGTLSAAAILVSGDSGNAASELVVNGGTVEAGQIAGLSNGSVTFTNGALTFTQDNPAFFIGFDAGGVTLNGSAVTFDTQQYHVALDTSLDGTATLIKRGGGRLGLERENTYSGGTYLQQGEILIGQSGALGSGALEMDTSEIRSTASATLNQPKITVNAEQHGTFSTAAGTILTLAPAAFELGENATFRVGSPGNTGAVVFQASSASALAAGTGILSVGTGTLQAGNQQLSVLASQVEKVFVGSGATLDFNDQTEGGRVQALFGEGTVFTGTQTGTTLTVQSGSFGGLLWGNGSLAKTGAGTFTISGTHFANGGTTISEGTLLLNGVTQDITIAGGTLGGSGTLNILTLMDGVLAPGDSMGTLSAYAFEWAGGILEYQLGAGGLSDHLNLEADLAGNGEACLFLFLDEGATVGTTYDLISFQSSQIDIAEFGLANPHGLAGDFSYNAEGTILRFTVTSIPEPGTAGLLAAALAAGLLVRRRRPAHTVSS